MDLALQILIALAAASVPALLTAGYLLRRESRMAQRLDAHAQRLDEISARTERVEKLAMNVAQERERSLHAALQQVQADVKLLEMQMRDAGASREAPELLEIAVKLAREGASTEHIVERTRLPVELIESITALHAGRR